MQQKTRLTEEKVRKIVTGATVAGVLLIVFLVAILIVQFVQIGVVNRRRAEYDRQIEQYEALIESGAAQEDLLQLEETLRSLAIENGWEMPEGISD